MLIPFSRSSSLAHASGFLFCRVLRHLASMETSNAQFQYLRNALLAANAFTEKTLLVDLYRLL